MLDILLVDDDDLLRTILAEGLSAAGHHVVPASSGKEALALLAERPFDLALCDVQMPQMDGLALLRRLRQEAPQTTVILMTGFGEIPHAVEALRAGAADYVTKPLDPEGFVRTVVQPIDEQRRHMKSFAEARAKFVEREAGVELVGESLGLRQLRERIGVVAKSDVSVVVGGEPGTGKKLVARTLHAGSPRRDGPFVVVPCATVPAVIAEAETRSLGATRAGARRDEWFLAASGGTLVLDGIDTLSPAAQGALLRILDEPKAAARRGRDWQPLGVRIVSLTTEAPSRLVTERGFSKPLFFRLNAMQLRLPALRGRDGDLYLLVCHFLRELTPPGRRVPNLTARAWKALTAYAFPGNLRELRWALEHALAVADGREIDRDHLPHEIGGPVSPAARPPTPSVRAPAPGHAASKR